MSQENVELIRRGYELFNAGGPQAVISAGIWAPEIVFDFSLSDIAGLGVYRGHDQIRAFFEEDWFGSFPFEEWEVAVDELIDHGDQVIALSRQRGRGVSSGAAAELELAQICTLRGGEVVRVETYIDRKKALEAGGQAE